MTTEEEEKGQLRLEGLKRAGSWLLNNKPGSRSFVVPQWDHPFLTERNTICVDYIYCLELNDGDAPGTQKVGEILFAVWLSEGKNEAIKAGFVVPDDPSGKGYKIQCLREVQSGSTFWTLIVHLHSPTVR